jgi:hypothetical protein
MPERHGSTAETASVIAARQLAEEAKRRRLPPELRRRRPLVVPLLPEAPPGPESAAG